MNIQCLELVYRIILLLVSRSKCFFFGLHGMQNHMQPGLLIGSYSAILCIPSSIVFHCIHSLAVYLFSLLNNLSHYLHIQPAPSSFSLTEVELPFLPHSLPYDVGIMTTCLERESKFMHNHAKKAALLSLEWWPKHVVNGLESSSGAPSCQVAQPRFELVVHFGYDTLNL